MTTQVVAASAAAKHIAVYLSAIHLDVCLTRTIETFQRVSGLAVGSGLADAATTDCGNLATTEKAATHMTVIELYLRFVNNTVVDVSTTKQAAGILEEGVGGGFGVVF